MFSSLKFKILLGVYAFIMISIPLGAYVLAQRQTVFKSRASEPKTSLGTITSAPSPTTTAADQLENQISNLTANPSPYTGSTPATSYGPTLNLKVNFEGRPKDNQSGRLFIGIIEGDILSTPKFLLSFTVDLPATGQYNGLSLAGLTPGTKYSALLKGPSQIASSAAFLMSPAATNLNNGDSVNLFSGDLNDDNVIDAADYSIAQKLVGATASSPNWNDNVDLNKDGLINILDLSIISKNMGKIGDSGTWTSPLPKTSTPSASLRNTPIGGPGGNSQNGYWMWIPAQ